MNTKILIPLFLLIPFVVFSQEKQEWSLHRCISYALRKNIQIKQNTLNVKLAEENIRDAKSNFLPTVNGNAGANINFGSSIDPATNSRKGTSKIFGNNYGINSSISVFNGFRNSNTLKKAELGLEANRLELETIKNNVYLNIVNNYLNVLFAKENLRVAKEQHEISKQLVQKATIRYEEGVIAKVDVLNTKSTEIKDLQNIINQENALNIALVRLAQLLQIDPKGFDIQKLDVDVNKTDLIYKNAYVVFDKALYNQPNMKKAKLNMKIADIDIDIAKSFYLPSVSASASASSRYGHNFSLPNGFSNDNYAKQITDNFGYGAGLSVNIPIFSAFKNDINVAKAKIGKDLAESNYEIQRLQLRQNIEQAYLDAKAAAMSFKSAEIALKAQKETFKNALESYKYGTMTLFDFEQVRGRQVAAESTLIRAKYDYVFKTKVLKFYYGDKVLN